MQIAPILIILIIGIFSVLTGPKEQAKKNAAAQRAKAAQRPPAGPAQKQAAKAGPDTMLPPRPLTPTLHDHSGMFEGSLHADDGTEGSDPHDHGFDHEVDMPSMHSEENINASLAADRPAAPSAKAAPLLDWAPDSLVRAFVMQEVLRRPDERRSVRAMPHTQG
ncbi:MAG: hypothetical protein IKP10_02445 [Clostridia bacterium]|nr:hypothetical protein [Clostridia bacterium]